MVRLGLLLVTPFLVIIVATSTDAYGRQVVTSSNLLTCSPSPCVLPPIQISEGGFEVTDAPIAVNPVNPRELLVGSSDLNCPSPSYLGFHLSTDGGSSWSLACMAVAHVRGKVYWPVGDDPGVGFDRNGVAYISGTYQDSEEGTTGFVGVESSRDGVKWSTPVVALGGLSQTSPLSSWLTVDTNPTSPYVDNVYVAAPIIGVKGRIYVAHSSDGGATWIPVGAGPVETGFADDEFNNMVIGKDGTVYLAWQHCVGTGPATYCGDGTAYMVFSKSRDGGNSWSQTVLMQRVVLNNQDCQCPIGILPNADVRVSDYPAIGVDNSNGPYAGNIYAVMNTWTGTYLRVGVVHSTDGGSTWSKPVFVAPPSDNHDQFAPWLSVSSSGLVGVSWLDRRNDPANLEYQAFATISSDGGTSFRPNVQLTTAFSNPKVNGYFNNEWMGDYTGNTWVGPDFIAAWMDSSNGVDMQDVLGGIRVK